MASQNNYLVQVSLLLVFLCLQNCLAYNVKKPTGKRILVYAGASTYSMRISMWPLIESLIEKGHHVAFVSSQEPKIRDPRVEDYAPKKLQEWFNSFEDNGNFLEQRLTGENRWIWYDKDFSEASCEALYADPEALEWIRNSKFDLVVVDSVNECAYGLAHYFNAKMVVFSTFTVAPWYYDSYGLSTTESSWAADVTQYFPPFDPTFWSRMATAVNQLVFQFIREYSYFPKIEEMSRKGLAKLGVNNLPDFMELEKTVSLTFITTHYAQEYPRAFPPNVIPIGGLALTGKVKPLPKEMEDFINKGKNGFIYISFGTLFDFSKLEQHQKDTIINALLQFPDIQFIWKAGGGVGVDLPENFLVSKWVPQQDVLAHPKIRAFITHGGLGSINEAIYHGVPMVAFPLLFDQDFNTNFLEPRGIGITLEILTLTTDQFKDAIERIIKDPKYQKTMKRVSILFKDRPMTPVDTTVWWIEFVLRHDSEEITEYMQSRSIHQSWWVRRQIDVWVFLASVVLLTFVITGYILCRLLKLVCSRSGEGLQQRKHKQH